MTPERVGRLGQAITAAAMQAKVEEMVQEQGRVEKMTHMHPDYIVDCFALLKEFC